MSILGGFRQSVSRATVCLLGQPKKAIGHESQIEPWLAIASALLASAQKAAGRTRTKMTPRTSRESEKENRARAKCISAANRGWMSEKYPLPAGQEKCFYLTSPFIEPATSQLISLGGTATEGFAAVSLFNPARTDPEFRQFQRRYRYQFDESPDEYAAYAYDGINLLIAAIEKAGPDRSRVMNELRSHQSRDWEGITGKMHFDERLNNMASPGMARVEGGRFVYWMPAQT